jgi:hypothetical protein
MANKKQLGPNIEWDKVVRLFLRTIPLSPGPEIYDLLKDLQRSRGELGEKVKRAASALEDASNIVTELEGELTTKVRQVERLKTQYERYQQLATVEEGKAKALIEQLQLTLGAGRSRERWIALAINIVAGIIVFVLGVWLSPWIKTLLGIGG